MKSQTLRAGAVLIALVLAGFSSAKAEESRDSADASSSTDAGPPPVLRVLETDPPNAESTPEPTVAELKDAPAVELARPAERCSARLVREWLKVSCQLDVKALALLSGSKDGVTFSPIIDPMEDNRREPPPPYVILPVRRGDRRVVEFAAYRPHSRFCGRVETFILSEQWLEGDAGPLVTLAVDTSSCY